MNFGSRLPAMLERSREAAEMRMRGTCRILRPGAWVSDGEGGGSNAPSATVYEGKFYARYPGVAQEQNTEVTSGTVVVSRLVARIPFGTVIRPGDVLEVLIDPDNPQMEGTVLTVASIDDQSQASAQRLLCNDFQSGVYTGAGENQEGDDE